MSRDYRADPSLYRGDEPDLMQIQPYAGEIAPHVRPDDAEESAAELYELYLRYKEAGDRVGMDMTRRFLEYAAAQARQRFTPPQPPFKPQPFDIFRKTLRMVTQDPDRLG
jgi:hypothetical protein